MSLLVFAPGFHVLEGLPCLHISHFGYEKGLNDLLAGGAPCPLARIDAVASCAVQRGSASGARAARNLARTSFTYTCWIYETKKQLFQTVQSAPQADRPILKPHF